MQVLRQGQRQVVVCQRRKAQDGDDHDGPDVGTAQQHGAQRDLQQVQKNEGVAGAATQVQLHREHRHINQQCQKQLHVAHRAARAQTQQAHHVEDCQAADDEQHLLQWQLQAQAVVRHLDGEHLAHHRNPAQLNQLLQVLDAGGCIRGACIARRSGQRRVSAWWVGVHRGSGGGWRPVRPCGAHSVPHTSRQRQP